MESDFLRRKNCKGLDGRRRVHFLLLLSGYAIIALPRKQMSCWNPLRNEIHYYVYPKKMQKLSFVVEFQYGIFYVSNLITYSQVCRALLSKYNKKWKIAEQIICTLRWVPRTIVKKTAGSTSTPTVVEFMRCEKPIKLRNWRQAWPCSMLFTLAVVNVNNIIQT